MLQGDKRTKEVDSFKGFDAPDLAHPTSIAIVLTGLLMGVLSARVLGGIISQFLSLGNIYWMGVGSNNRCKKSK